MTTRTRTRFNAWCRNPKCAFYKVRRGPNFVITGKFRLKDGRIGAVLRCDCGVHRRVRSDLTRGLHLYNPLPDTTLHRLEAAVRATSHEKFFVVLSKPLRRRRQVDAGFGFDLARIVRGESISDVAKANSTKTLANQEYAAYDSDGMVEGIPSPYQQAGGIKAWLKLYPLYCLSHEKMLKSTPAPKKRVKWGDYNNSKRAMKLRVKNALGDMESTMQVLKPYLRRSVLSREEYKRACRVLGVRHVANDYRKIAAASFTPSTLEEVRQRLIRALEVSELRRPGSGFRGC